MSVAQADITVRRMGPNMIRVFVGGSYGTLYWYWNGGLVASGALPFRDFMVSPGEGGQWFVSDDAEEAVPSAYPYRVRLEWEVVSGATKYAVLLQSPGDLEGALVGVVEAANFGSMNWTSDVLADGLEAVFVVVPVDAAGNFGIPRAFSVVVVRPPDPPGDVVATYTGGVLSVA